MHRPELLNELAPLSLRDSLGFENETNHGHVQQKYRLGRHRERVDDGVGEVLLEQPERVDVLRVEVVVCVRNSAVPTVR